MTEELKACPWCGKAPTSFRSGMKDDGLMIECQTPNCVNPHVSFIPPASAIAAWNTRAPVKVKPLKFTKLGVEWEAHCGFGMYLVAEYEGDWSWWSPQEHIEDSPCGFEDSEREALAAAQADYERRIREALA